MVATALLVPEETSCNKDLPFIMSTSLTLSMDGASCPHLASELRVMRSMARRSATVVAFTLRDDDSNYRHVIILISVSGPDKMNCAFC
jgi:hypothetical protein